MNTYTNNPKFDKDGNINLTMAQESKTCCKKCWKFIKATTTSTGGKPKKFNYWACQNSMCDCHWKKCHQTQPNLKDGSIDLSKAKESSDWEKEFDKKFVEKVGRNKIELIADYIDGETVTADMVKEFISNLLSQTATEHYAKGRLKNCEQSHGELIAEALDKNTQAIITAHTSGKNETIKQVEGILKGIKKEVPEVNPDYLEATINARAWAMGNNQALSDILSKLKELVK